MKVDLFEATVLFAISTMAAYVQLTDETTVSSINETTSSPMQGFSSESRFAVEWKSEKFKLGEQESNCIATSMPPGECRKPISTNLQYL